MSSHSTGTESSNTNNEPSVSYRINSHVGVEFISTTTTTTQGPVDNHDNNQAGGGSDTTTNNNNNDNNPLTQVMQQIQPLDYAANGLQSISITNFTGRIVFHRMGVDVPDCPSISIYSESSISNSGGAHSEYSESHTGGSRAGSRAGSFVVEPTVAVVATTGVSRRDDDDESESKQHRPQLPETTPITSKGGGSGAGVLASIVQSLAHQGGGGGTTATVTPTNDNDDDDNNDHHNGGDWDDSAGGLSLNAALSVPSSYVPPPAPRSLGPPRSMAPSPLRVKTGNNDREDSINRQLPFRPPPEQPGAVTATKGHDDHSIVSSSQPTARTPSNAEASLNRLHKVLTANSKISRTIPDGLRTKRLEQRAVAQPSVARTTTTTTTETTLAASNTATTTPSLYLHFLCAQPTVTLDELHNGLNQSTNAIRTKDASGRLPLHILGDNETLITSDKGRNVATLFAGHLMNEYPHATTTADDDGFIPFARLIADWIDWANDQVKAKEEEQQQGEGEIEDLGDEGGGGGNNKNKNELDDNLDFYPGRPSSLFGSRKSTSAGAMTQHWHIGSYYKKIFPRVEVWEEVEWCFSMLSAELDLLGRNSTVPMFQRLRMNKPATEGALRHSATTYHLPSNDRKALVDALMVSMPNLLRTVLLIDDDGMDTRERILEMAICRRLLLCPQAVDQWLIDMINHGGIPARRAVDYLCLVSKTSVEDYTGGFGTIHSGDLDAFNEDRQKVFEAIGALKGTIASLVTLQNRETDRAAATAVIWHTMSQKLSRPFVLGLVLIDLLLHITLMVSFRSMVRPDSTLSAMEVDQELVVYLISVHYLLRKACEAWVLLTVSPTVLRAYFSNMWTMFDTIAIVFTVWATIWYDHSPDGTYNTGLNTLVVGLLWVKVLGFLKVVNKDMSTFIMALSQILYDIRFFMVVLVVCVIMFGDMFYIAVSTEEDTEFCSREQDSGTIEDFCDSSWSSYLRVYSILLGDFELDDLTATTGTTTLFIIFTVFGVVILLNVLIAVISDSYEKATMSSSLLFGRARVLYVAQNEALERFLQPRMRTADAGEEAESSGTIGGDRRGVPVSCHKRARSAIRWTVLSAILCTALCALLFLLGLVIRFAQSQSWVNFCISLFMTLVITCALWVVSTFILDGILRDLLPDRAERVYDVIGKINNCLVSGISNRLFGLRKEKVQTLSNEEASDEDWAGRLKYLENVIERIIAESQVELKSEIAKMRAEMNEHFDDD